MQTLASTLKFFNFENTRPRCKHVTWVPRNGEQGVARSAAGKAYAVKHACGQAFSSALCSMTFCCCKINAAAILFCCCKINAAAILHAYGYTCFNNACRNAAAILSAHTRFNNACKNDAAILIRALTMHAGTHTRFNNACRNTAVILSAHTAGKAYAAKHACGQAFSSALCSMTFCCCKINAAAILSACGYTRFNNACRNAAAILSACGYTRFNNECMYFFV